MAKKITKEDEQSFAVVGESDIKLDELVSKKHVDSKQVSVVEVDNIKYAKVRKVKSPSRGTSRSAGIDMFIPEFDEKFVKDILAKNPSLVDVKSIYSEAILRNHFSQNALLYDGDEQNNGEKKIVLRPGTSINIPSGIHFKVLENTALFVKNKSGVSSKNNLDKLAELIDEDYQGEVHINVINAGNDEVTLYPNQKIIQLVLAPVLYSEPQEVDYKNLYITRTTRGDKGFGEATGNE